MFVERLIIIFFFNNLDWGPVPRLPPESTAASVADCTIPRKSSLSVRQVSLASTTRVSPVASRGGTMGEKWWPNGAWDMHPPRVLLHVANLQHRTDNLTSLPKEGVLRIFYRPLKIRRLLPGLNLGAKGQHATSAPPKPLNHLFTSIYSNV